jgi:hypothetical protein
MVRISVFARLTRLAASHEYGRVGLLVDHLDIPTAGDFVS